MADLPVWDGLYDGNGGSDPGVPDDVMTPNGIGTGPGGLPFPIPTHMSCGGPAMPAKSKAQQKAAGAALAAKRGEQKVGELKGASKSMYKSMSEKQLDELASTKRKGKPEHASKK
ncbi:DUF3008 family protein [Inquilinus limosus]|nr:DUF3008 family protein [Inquilinus limosus]